MNCNDKEELQDQNYKISFVRFDKLAIAWPVCECLI